MISNDPLAIRGCAMGLVNLTRLLFYVIYTNYFSIYSKRARFAINELLSM